MPSLLAGCSLGLVMVPLLVGLHELTLLNLFLLDVPALHLCFDSSLNRGQELGIKPRKYTPIALPPYHHVRASTFVSHFIPIPAPFHRLPHCGQHIVTQTGNVLGAIFIPTGS